MPRRIERYCRACANLAELTEDHVPPKGCASLSRAELRSLVDHMQMRGRPGRITQSGVRFKTLCDECNSTRLGKQYDPALIDLTHKVSRALSAVAGRLLTLPDPMMVTVKPQRVARAIVGHLLAFDRVSDITKPPPRATFPSTMREYFTDPNAPLPKELALYYWTYPSRTLVIARSFTKTNIRFYPRVTGDTLKFFPLGYWLVFDQPDARSLAKLVQDRAMGIDQEVDLPIQFRRQPPLDFPEAPASDEAVLFHDQAGLVARSYLTKRQRVPPRTPRRDDRV